METRLIQIDDTNFMDAFHLELADGQEKYVSHPIRSLAQAYVYYKQCTPFQIAMKLYLKAGFTPTGCSDEDEIELAAQLH